jgi:hypothetical protein
MSGKAIGKGLQVGCRSAAPPARQAIRMVPAARKFARHLSGILGQFASSII